MTLTFFLALAPFWLSGQQRDLNSDLSGGIPRDEVPLAVVWGLSLYGGVTSPFAPDPFVDFWQPSVNIAVDADILLRNDAILGFTVGHTSLKFDQAKFWRLRGVDSDAKLGSDFNIPITTVLLSFRGIENYMLYKFSAAYEVGGGIYSLKNTEIDVTYLDPYGSYTISEAERIDFGLFAGLGVKVLITDTLQLTVKGRFHHVFKPSQYHQFYDLVVGFTLL
ncbi:hypothetical protein EH222_11865 [candidate division KSB1 bacterium]|nr:MAG: hypothetical protein EH222_11865 [candidate division KSB1 bacterium]